MTSILPAEQVKEIFIDFRNTEANMVKDNTNNNNTLSPTTTTIPTTENKELIENKFLYSIHIIFFVSSIIVFISIIPATVKDRNIRR